METNTSNSKKAMVSYRQLFKYLSTREKWITFLAFLMSMAQGAMMPLFSVVYGEVTEDLTPTKPAETIRSAASKTALYMFILGIGIFVFSFSGTYLWSYIGAKLTIKVKKMYFSSVLTQEMGWFDQVNPERLTITYVEDMQKFSDAVGFKNHVLIYSVGTAILGFIVGYIYGWLFSAIVTVTFPIIMIGMILFVVVNQRESRMSKKAYESAGASSEQTLGAIKTVKSLNGEDHEFNLYSVALEEAKRVSIRYGFIAAFCYGFFMLCLTSSYGLNYWIGSVLVDKQVHNDNLGESYNIKSVVTIFFAIVNGGFALGNTSPVLRALGMGKEAAYNIYKIIERVSQIPLDNKDAFHPTSINGDIEFLNVHFTYPSRPDNKILNGVSLKIPAGKKVALVGETGCGKSTSIQMIERYYDPSSGVVLIDGKDIKEYNLTSLRKFIGYVGQEPVLFAMSIRENLLIAKPDATDEEMYDALAKANALGFVMHLEHKLDSYVGSGGSQLSGGQKQRLSIARSILQNPKILLLDEATSALDRKNEKEIQDTLDKFAESRTTVTIAHRLSTVMNSDIIYVFEKGRVVESGNHEELFAMGGFYTKLVNIQLKGLQLNEEVKPDEIGVEGDAIVEGNENPNNIEAEPGMIVDTVTNPMIDSSPKLSRRLSSKHSVHSMAEEIKKHEVEEEIKVEKNTKRMRVYLKGNRGFLISGCFFALLSGCVLPLFALFLADMLTVLTKFDVIRAGLGPRLGYTLEQTREETVDIALKFVYIAIFALFTNFIQLSFFNSLAQKITMSIRQDLFRHFITRDQAFFDKRENSPGELCSVLAKDCLIVNSTVSTSYGAILTGVGSFVCGMAIAFYASWRIALVSLACTPLIFITGVVKTKKNKTQTKSGSDETMESKTFQETCTNMRTVLSLNAHPGINKSFNEYVENENKLTTAENFKHSGVESIAQFSTFITYSVVFWAGAEFTLRYGLSFQDLFRSFMGVVFAAFGASMAQQFTSDISEAKKAASRIFDFMDIQNKIRNSSNPCTEPIIGEIEFKNVSFTYPERIAPCFEGLSFRILPKQKVAFAGPSGTGKSTIFSLLYRYYEPSAGQILIDGRDIKEYDIKHLRASLGMVSQEPVLFNQSISYNIRYNREDIGMDQIREAATVANAINFIERDEGVETHNSGDGKGFDRFVGLRGSKLSGGQKQRVAIARTVVRKPCIYMFDEATSALDTESEKIVQEAINNISKENTSLSIAHRISTIRNSDVIFVIDGGKVVEQGTYDYLMASKGVFFKINEAH